MKQFFTFSDAADQMDALQTLNNDLTAEVETITADRDELAETLQARTTELEKLQANHVGVVEQLAEADENARTAALEIAALETELEKATAEVADIPEKVVAEAINQVAAIGHEPVEDIPAEETPENTLSEVELRNKHYASLRKG